PDFPHLPELPARGPGADLIGRTAALLVDVAVDLVPAGWRLVPRPGVDLRRARDLLERDLDLFTELAGGYTGPLKLQAAGPWPRCRGPWWCTAAPPAFRWTCSAVRAPRGSPWTPGSCRTSTPSGRRSRRAPTCCSGWCRAPTRRCRRRRRPPPACRRCGTSSA